MAAAVTTTWNTAAERRAAEREQLAREFYSYARVVDVQSTPPECGLFTVDRVRRNAYGEPDPNEPVQPPPAVEQKPPSTSRSKKRKRGGNSLEKIRIPDYEPDEYGRVMGVIWPYCTHLGAVNIHSLEPFEYFSSEEDHYLYRSVPDSPDLEDNGNGVEILMKSEREEEMDGDSSEVEEGEKKVPWYKKVDPEVYARAYTAYRPSEFKAMKEISEEIETISKAKRRRLNTRSILTAAWNAGAAIYNFLTSKMQD